MTLESTLRGSRDAGRKPGEVLVFLGLLVPFLRARPRPVCEEALPEAVGAHDVQRLGPSGFGQAEAGRSRGHQTFLLQPLQEAYRLAAGDLDAAGHALRGRGQPVVFELVELLQDVFHPHPLGKAGDSAHMRGEPAVRPEHDRGEENQRGKEQECQSWIDHARKFRQA